MIHKTLKLNGNINVKAKRAKRELHFANFIPRGLPRLRTHFWVWLRHFVKDYSVPLTATILVMIVLGAALVTRIVERATLVDILLGAPGSGQDYGSLLSRDKTSEPVRGDINEQLPSSPITNQPAASNTSTFSTNPGTTNLSTSTSPGTTPPGGGTTTPVPFSSSISFLRQDSVTLECSTSKPNKGSCSKKYTFAAVIRTLGGPGVVSYGWRSNAIGVNEDSSFAAGTGESSTILQKQVTLSCNSAGNYTLQLIMSSPSQAQSAVLGIAHDCKDI